MELPYGIRVKQPMGGWTLRELNSYFSEKSITGYALVHPQQSGNNAAITGTIVYLEGQPVLGFISDGKTDRADERLIRNEVLLSSKTAAVEGFQVREHQVSEIAAAFKVPLPSAPGVSGHGLPASPGSISKGNSSTAARPVSYPEAGGRFLKAVNVSEVQSYLQGASSFTGHAILVKKTGQANLEYHLLVVKGIAVGAYSASEGTSGARLCNRLLGEAGVIELYHLDQPAVELLLEKYPHISLKADPQQGSDATAVRPVILDPGATAPVIKTPAMATKVATEAVLPYEPVRPVLREQRPGPSGQGSLPHLLATAMPDLPEAAPVRLAGEAKSLPAKEPEQDELDDFDFDYVRNVEREFSSQARDLLETYKLSYLCVPQNNKKA